MSIQANKIVKRFKDEYNARKAVDLEKESWGTDEIEGCYIGGSNVIALCEESVGKLGAIHTDLLDTVPEEIDMVEKEVDGETRTLYAIEGENHTDHLWSKKVEIVLDLFDMDGLEKENVRQRVDRFYDDWPVRINDPNSEMFVVVSPHINS